MLIYSAVVLNLTCVCLLCSEKLVLSYENYVRIECNIWLLLSLCYFSVILLHIHHDFEVYHIFLFGYLLTKYHNRNHQNIDFDYAVYNTIFIEMKDHLHQQLSIVIV